VALAGLQTLVHPGRQRWPSLRVSIAAGKFHGVMAALTPTGCRKPAPGYPAREAATTCP